MDFVFPLQLHSVIGIVCIASEERKKSYGIMDGGSWKTSQWGHPKEKSKMGWMIYSSSSSPTAPPDAYKNKTWKRISIRLCLIKRVVKIADHSRKQPFLSRSVASRLLPSQRMAVEGNNKQVSIGKFPQHLIPSKVDVWGKRWASPSWRSHPSPSIVHLAVYPSHRR